MVRQNFVDRSVKLIISEDSMQYTMVPNNFNSADLCMTYQTEYYKLNTVQL